ncbi:MAG: HIT family protein [Phycisphaerales bacterium]
MSIFSRIIRGEIPCHRLHEDPHVLAFLDVHPVSRGHALIVPKQEVTTLGELDDDTAAALGRVLPRVCRAVQRVTGCTAYNLLQNNGALAGQEVMHVHFHLIPRYPGDEAGSGLSVRWRARPIDHADAANLARDISRVLA